jgi:hypothetical protein
MAAREHYLGTRVTESEYDRVVAAAEAVGLKPSEWCRDVLLSASGSRRPVLHSLIEEILAIRIILQSIILNLTTNGKDVTRKSLGEACAFADSLKAQRARRLLGLPDPPTQ